MSLSAISHIMKGISNILFNAGQGAKKEDIVRGIKNLYDEYKDIKGNPYLEYLMRCFSNILFNSSQGASKEDIVRSLNNLQNEYKEATQS